MADQEKVMNFTSLDSHPATTEPQTHSLQHHQSQQQQQQPREQLFYSTPNIYDNAQDFVFNEDLYEREYESAGEEFGRGVGDDDDMDELMEKIKVGVCAMAKKVKSKPMEEILNRLRHHLYFEIIIFDQDMIVNKPITEWPRVDCLISFHSKDFPLSKAQEYTALYNPFLINDLDKQWDIMDRTKVYQTLSDAGIELPRYAIPRP